MEVEVSDPSLADELVAFLRDARYAAIRADRGTLAVEAPASIPDELARMALEESLAAWQSLHPGVRARRRASFDI